MTDNLFSDLADNLEAARKGFLASSLYEDGDGVLRTVEEAKLVLDTLESIYNTSSEILENYPSLEALFEKEYGPFTEFNNRENLLEVCFLDDYLFPKTEAMPISMEIFSKELLNGYKETLVDWWQATKGDHEKTQDQIKNHFDLQIKTNELACGCNNCLADYRTKLREAVFREQVELIDSQGERLFDLMLNRKIDDISDFVQKLRRNLDKNIHKIRYRLKRGSLNKLDAEIKAHFKTKFSYHSELGKVYKEKLQAFFNGLLDEQGIKPELISPEEYERFFIQLGVGIWKPASVLRREFEKLVKSIMSFKRKDISATILKDYLGQFWLHAEARRKQRKVVYHMGPTNSGKTYNAIEALALASHGCYLAPLRLLASELFDTLNEKGIRTSLLTGEEVIEVEHATHYSSTIEMAKLHEEFDCVVIDEIQMITDLQRGWAWTRALVNINADEVHLCGDHSVFELVEKILKLTGDTLEVRNYERKTKLAVERRPIKLVDLKENDALIVFSRRNALKYKMDLENLGFKVSIVYGRLSPEVRREQARKFDAGETDIMVSTDAIAMGMNLPVKRIVFSTLSKFIDSKEHPITNSEIKQIAGRAGRYQRFPEGAVNCLQSVEDGLERLEIALACDLDQKEYAMVGPDLEIFKSVNNALEEHDLPILSLSEFLRLFNTMTFEKPFYCVELKEMIELAEMVEAADPEAKLSDAEVFGFTCAPVNLGLVAHVQYYVWILNHYVAATMIENEPIDVDSDDIDYLETAIKCVELYQWLARHFSNKNFSFSELDLLENKSQAIESLNGLLSEKISRRCSSCGVKLADTFQYNICEACFDQRRSRRWQKPKEGGSGRRDDKRHGSGKPKSGGGPGKGSGGKRPGKRPRRSKNKAAAFVKG